MVRLTLSPEAWERAGEMAKQLHKSRSAVIEELIWACGQMLLAMRGTTRLGGDPSSHTG